MAHSLLSPEKVAQIELRMDPLEVYGCIFLLYDTVDMALQDICTEIHTCRRYLPVLDSVLFNGGVFHEGPLVKWSKSLLAKGINWSDRLLEALMIIKEFWIIKFLDANQRDLELRFLPQQANTSCHVDLIRKVLYLMVDDLSKDDWNDLRLLIIEETKLQSVPAKYTEIPECLLLILMSRNFIQLKKKDQRVNLSLLFSCLKRLGKDYWAHQLKSIENAVNGEQPGISVENGVENVAWRKAPSVRFNLDPENPGTILIFNIVDYGKEVVNGNGISLGVRNGSHVDVDRLQNTFELLGFQRSVIPDPTAEDIILIIRENLAKFCSEAKKSKKERCFAVAILAHGDKDGVYCTKGNLLTWDAIRAELRHPDTKGLARLLLNQACKGNSQATKPDNIEEDGVGSESDSVSKNLKDIFELSSSVSGFAAYRDIVHGSFFIRSFCKHILQFGSDCDLNQITTLINKDLDSKKVECSGVLVSMTAELIVTPKKLLYLGVPQKEKLKADALVQVWEHVEKTECMPRNPTVYLQQNEEVKNNPPDAKSKMTENERREEDSEQNCEEELGGLAHKIKMLALKLEKEKRNQ
ncbi:caspase-8-like [Thrips palmi]|uniref:Caspase-8-like n=1 Tax=Thrips palmi TaxID=161013 RepID=A0A6P9ADC9_THRPL|nr:caspase-8-like [Thrips palmi]